MIIKVKSEGEAGTIQSWRMFDKAEGVHFTVYENGDDAMANTELWPKCSDVQEVKYMHQGIRPAVHPLLFVAFHSESTGPMHLFCDTECYLLNDNGRTIERLI